MVGNVRVTLSGDARAPATLGENVSVAETPVLPV